MMIFRISYIIGILAVSFPGVDVNAQDRPVRVVNIEDIWRQQPDEKKKEFLEQVARRGGPFVKIPGRWQLIDDPFTAHAWAMRENEPLSDEVLEVLTEVMPDAEGPDLKFGIAALLYRYQVDGGREVIVERLQENAYLPAATILAANAEVEFKAAILDVLEEIAADSGITQMLERERGAETDTRRRKNALILARKSLTYALGMWGDDEIMQVLLRHAEDTRGGTRLIYVQAMLLSDRAGEDDFPLRMNEWVELQERPEGLDTEAMAVRLRQADDGPYVEELVGRMNETLAREDQRWRGKATALMRMLSAAGVEGSFDTARQQARELLAVPRSRVGRIHVEAAVALGHSSEKEDLGLALELLEKIHKEASHVPTRNKYRIVHVLLKQGDPEIVAGVEDIVGRDMVERIEQLAQLRRLPSDLVPRSSRGLSDLPEGFD